VALLVFALDLVGGLFMKGIGNTKEVKTYRIATTTAHLGVLLISSIIALWSFDVINGIVVAILLSLATLLTIGSIAIAYHMFKIMCPD
jgi:MFS superfamily sulfate permease-like transporter